MFMRLYDFYHKNLNHIFYCFNSYIYVEYFDYSLPALIKSHDTKICNYTVFRSVIFFMSIKLLRMVKSALQRHTVHTS